ncbi:MAG: hypothetical protein IPL08_14210 [Saprospiraceae bacterium]|nr:hypothetical protein [Saprospiraceae bacterium]
MSDDWVEGSDRLFNAIGDRVLANQLIKNKSYTKLLCNIKPDGSMIWQKLNATATGQGTIIQI